MNVYCRACEIKLQIVIRLVAYFFGRLNENNTSCKRFFLTLQSNDFSPVSRRMTLVIADTNNISMAKRYHVAQN